ncbi:ASTRA-associated protein 1 [Exophiala dermatitidis]
MEQQRPAVPTYILRGHEAAIHALHFYSNNAFLVSGDSDGWLVIWSLTTKRPVAVWKGHDAGIMAIHHWTDERLISHGRDHKLRVWQVRPEDLDGLSQRLPAEQTSADTSTQAQPWLLHSLSVNALNFCAFSMCDEEEDPHQQRQRQNSGAPRPQLIASPNGLDSGGIDISQLPSEKRISQIHSQKESSTGMVMAVSLFHDRQNSETLVLVSGYEDGRVMVHSYHGRPSADGQSQSEWELRAVSKPHSQPVLSLGVLPSRDFFFTSGADAMIAKFPLALSNRKEEGDLQPEKIVNTKHAGQQGLSVRLDGKIFATAGWDARVRVYSSRTLKELAVLKWHKVGCYATAFADIHIVPDKITSVGESNFDSTVSPGTSHAVTSSVSALDMIKRQREERARMTHWLAAGGKDGKISLWDIY